MPKDSSNAESYWAATARSAVWFPSLSGDVDTEVAILGGGFTGLSVAHHLRLADTECVVIDAKSPGWGASGRNGGLAVLRYKKGFSALSRCYGDAITRRLYALVMQAVDLLEETIAQYNISCHFERCGHITAAHAARALSELERDIRWLRNHVSDNTPTLLGRDSIADETGTDVYPGGYLDPRAATLHPLEYAHGLASALVTRGVPVFASTAATAVHEDNGHVIVETDRGRIRARQAILATNGYTLPLPGTGDLHKRIVPVCSSAVATTPLDERTGKLTLPSGYAVTDTKRLTGYFRKLPDGGVLFGGRADITGRDLTTRAYRGLEARMTAVLPQLADCRIAHRWSGMVAVTQDDFPRIGRLGERIHFAVGYGGRGVALSSLLGRELAQAVHGRSSKLGPISDTRFKSFPFHSLRIPGMRAMAVYYGVRDALDR